MVLIMLGVSIFALVYFAMKDSGWAVLCFAVACLTGLLACDDTEFMKAQHKAQAEEAQREATPHVIREADGCKVYAFKTDIYHYFTRCGSTVTTETRWSQACGKNCTKQMSDTIVTEGNK